MLISEYNALYSPKTLQEEFKKHEISCRNFARFCISRGIPYWRIGYEYTAADMNEYWEINKSGDYDKKLAPDFKILWKGEYLFVDPKSGRNWLPALGLYYNTKREYPVFYVLNGAHLLPASEAFNNQIEYFTQLRIYKEKKEEEWKIKLHKSNFSALSVVETDDKIGEVWSEYHQKYIYRSGDTCLGIRNDAPLLTVSSHFQK